MKEKLFSVIIPTCRRNELLAKCLDRLAPGFQTLDAALYEVIVSDDGPASEAAPLAKQYPWVHYTAGPKRGPAANRNHGVRQATGQWLVFTDDDCLPDANWLRSFEVSINGTAGIVAMEGSVHPLDERRSALDEAPLNVTGGNFWSCNICIKRSLFIEVQGFDEKFPHPHLEDIDLKIRIENTSGKKVSFNADARVFHPWRIKKPGKTMALYHEADFYFMQSKQGIKIRRLSLTKSIVLARLMPLKCFFSFKALLVIMYHLMIELLITHMNFTKWANKHPMLPTPGR